jgi:hypothetical protein
MPAPDSSSTEGGELVPLTLHFTPDQVDWLTDVADQTEMTIDQAARCLVREARSSDADGLPGTSPPGPPEPQEMNVEERPAPERENSGDEEQAPCDTTALSRLRQASETLESLRSLGEEDTDGDDTEPQYTPDTTQNGTPQNERSVPPRPTSLLRDLEAEDLEDGRVSETSSGDNERSGEDSSNGKGSEENGPPSMFDLAEQS